MFLVVKFKKIKKWIMHVNQDYSHSACQCNSDITSCWKIKLIKKLLPVGPGKYLVITTYRNIDRYVTCVHGRANFTTTNTHGGNTQLHIASDTKYCFSLLVPEAVRKQFITDAHLNIITYMWKFYIIHYLTNLGHRIMIPHEILNNITFFTTTQCKYQN